jgi:DNA/RNA endonuclease YhcR with UshA esterase domain
MKRIFSVLSSLLISSLIAHAQDAKSDDAKKYTPAEAKDLVGKTVTIAGKVSNVHQTERITHINFGKPYPNEDFTAVVFSAKTNLFDDLSKLAGKTVEVSGKVDEYQKKPQIVLNEKSQLKVIEEKGDAKSEKSEAAKPEK